jgi:hypothetical protein
MAVALAIAGVSVRLVGYTPHCGDGAKVGLRGAFGEGTQ